MNFLISQRHTQNQHGDWIDSLENNYVTLFESYNINLIPVSNIFRNLADILNEIKISGIILTGGGDVDPALYGGKEDLKLSISKSRDTTEFLLLNIAIKKNIPVLGICRGIQLINVFFHGKIIQDIKSIDKNNRHLTPGCHQIKITYQPLLAILNNIDSAEVNSYHNQGILNTMLGDKLSAFAEYTDLGLAEGIFHQKYPIAGIQWHPERKQSDEQLDTTLINAFLKRKLFWR